MVHIIHNSLKDFQGVGSIIRVRCLKLLDHTNIPLRRKYFVNAPGFFCIRNNLAISLAWQSHFDEAINILVKVVKYEIAYNNTGYIVMLNKQYPVAEKHFKKAIFISPSYYVCAARNLEKVENLKRLGNDP
ncbi:MAG: hypothetical protein KAS57_03605 [Gammaproteobacteria bacterium]|nr:hypothetical protein [Gammaproteobacteria bacterium]